MGYRHIVHINTCTAINTPYTHTNYSTVSVNSCYNVEMQCGRGFRLLQMVF